MHLTVDTQNITGFVGRFKLQAHYQADNEAEEEAVSVLCPVRTLQSGLCDCIGSSV